MSQPLAALKAEIATQIERHGMTKCTVKGCNDMRILTAVLEHLEQLEAQVAMLTQEREAALSHVERLKKELGMCLIAHVERMKGGPV